MKTSELRHTLIEASINLDKYEPNPKIHYNDIPKHIILPYEIPDLILMITPCRSGSTIQHRVFAASGIPSYQHPSKAILRNLMHNQSWDFLVPSTTFFAKETIGPYTQKESEFNALRAFLEAGYPALKIHTIFFLRSPLACATSWEEQFGVKRDSGVVFRNFLITYKQMAAIREYAIANDIHNIHYVYEALRDNKPTTVVNKLFAKLNLSFSEKTVSGWSELPRFGQPGSNIHYSPEPPIYAGGFHDVAENANALEYYHKSTIKIDELITPQKLMEISSSGLFDIYEEARRLAEEDLSIHIQPNQELQEYQRRHN